MNFSENIHAVSAKLAQRRICLDPMISKTSHGPATSMPSMDHEGGRVGYMDKSFVSSSRGGSRLRKPGPVSTCKRACVGLLESSIECRQGRETREQGTRAVVCRMHSRGDLQSRVVLHRSESFLAMCRYLTLALDTTGHVEAEPRCAQPRQTAARFRSGAG